MIRNYSPNAFADLQSHGHKLTEPRRLIIETLAGQTRALTAAELFEILDPRGVSLASVYRTLEILVELHLAETITQSTTEQRYIACKPGHHHHVICTQCWHVDDVDACLLEPVVDAVQARTGFEVQQHVLEFYGRCETCQR